MTNAYSISLILSITISFTVTLLLGKVVIPYLQKIKYGQTILEIGPSWHKNKQGTPTMGGIMFITGIVLATCICVPTYYKISEMFGTPATETSLMIIKIFAGLGMAVAYGVIGMMDDYVKISNKQNQGLTPKQKLILQFGIIICYMVIIHIANIFTHSNAITTIKIPFLPSIDLGIFYWPIFAIIVVGIVNAANLSDGVDGLSASVAFFIAIFYMIITNLTGMFGLSVESAALAGACLGFLFWNFHPAKIFMGDTGSLFLGAMVCAIGMASGLEVLMVLLAFVYIFEMFSVILQVLYFKFTHGKRLFKMSPIHHHFEMCGWSEAKICAVFSIATVILGSICLFATIYGM